MFYFVVSGAFQASAKCFSKVTCNQYGARGSGICDGRLKLGRGNCKQSHQQKAPGVVLCKKYYFILSRFEKLMITAYYELFEITDSPNCDLFIFIWKKIKWIENNATENNMWLPQKHFHNLKWALVHGRPVGFFSSTFGWLSTKYCQIHSDYEAGKFSFVRKFRSLSWLVFLKDYGNW